MIGESWGRFPKATQKISSLRWREEPLFPKLSGNLILPYGQGRSYGDCCLNDGGTLLSTKGLNHFIAWDGVKGLLTCEAGVTLYDIIRFSLPRGWFLPVSPGTQFVSVGGAIANDIHGKNHHSAGTFGNYVQSLTLLRSDGPKVCTPQDNAELFRATVGGIGLTGLIVTAQIQLTPVESPFIYEQTIRFRTLEEFFQLSKESERGYTFSVAWVDGLHPEGRGIFIRGNFAGKSEVPSGMEIKEGLKKNVPFDFPAWTLGRLSVKVFNEMYFHARSGDKRERIVSYLPFFYPLDSVENWNKLYGKQGFFQFQCVVPGIEPAKALLRRVAQKGVASFLSVIKEFGTHVSPGMLSFPRPGITICLDFPNRGEATVTFLRELDQMVKDAGGAIYTAKDATMAPQSFKAYYPRWSELQQYKDPQFSSSLWRRVTQE